MQGSAARQFTILVVLALAATLSPVSIDMLTPSLPGMSASLGSSPQTIELTIYSFLIGYGVAPSLWGVVSDRNGRRPVMIAGMLIYCASSIACALTDDPAWLIGLRFMQGVGGAAGATMARAIIRDLYGSSGTTRGMARMISLMAVVPFFMPLVGGLIARELSWNACFFLMTGIGALSLAAYFYLVPETRVHTPARGDTARQAITAILLHPVFAQHAVCNMFCISTLVLFAANFSFVAEHSFNFDSVSSGRVLALFNGSIAAGTYLVWSLMPRLGAHRSILVGAMASALGWLCIALLAQRGMASVALIAPLLVCSCMGCGIIMALCSGGAITPFSHNSGTASSLYLMIQSVGSSGISYVIGQSVPKQLFPIAVAIACCAGLAILSKILLSRGEPDNAGAVP